MSRIHHRCPLDIGGAFGIDRSDASSARMFDALASFGTGASGLGELGDLYDQTESDLMMLTQRIRPAYGFADQPNTLQQQLVLAAHLINANLGIRVIDTEIDGFDNPLGSARTGTRPCWVRSTTRSRHSSRPCRRAGRRTSQ